jgi:hypothetical protein
MSEESSQQELYTAAQFREYQEGHGQRQPDVHDHTGLVRDERVSRYLAVLSEVYDPGEHAERPEQLPGRAQELAVVQRMRRTAGTETAREALASGDMPTLKHLTGDAGQRADVSGLKAIEQLKATVTGPASMFYVWAEPGTGKTNFALLLAQLWKRERGSEALLASNIRTLRETDEWVDPEGDVRSGWLSSFGELEEWIQQDGDPLSNEQQPKLFIFDEASSSAGGSGSSGYETKQKMGPLAYKIRKYGGALIVIGHDGKDVHPLIRELGTAVHKESKKAATFYDDVKNRKGVGEQLAVEGIPPTDYRYDDKEPTAWSWEHHGEEDGEQYPPDQAMRDAAIATVIRAKEEGCSDREAAAFVPYSVGWVNSRWREYCDDGEHAETVNRVREVIA